MLLVGVMVTLTMASCVFDRVQDTSEDVDNPDRVRLVLRINALGNDAKNPDGVQELVKSLRIIIFDKSGFIEVNEAVDLESEEYLATRFSYLFEATMKANTKRLYLIANEESVNKVELGTDPEFTSDIPRNSLTALLDYFPAEPEPEDDEADHHFRGPLFEKILNALSFEPDYDSMRSGAGIYLPYASMYELGYFDLNSAHISRPFYLVPVATKIDFEVVNYRRSDIIFKDILLCNTNVSNYLNARLPEEDRKMTLEGKEVWWIEWLAACSLASQTAEDNVAFNQKWGWIDTYIMPDDRLAEWSLVPPGETWRMDKIYDKDYPDIKNFGPCYLPEGKNIIEEVDEETGEKSYRHRYSLKFKILDSNAGDFQEELTMDGFELDNTKALFRGTHLKVYIDLYEKAIEIYAEIVPWKLVPFRGYVQQDDDY